MINFIDKSYFIDLAGKDPKDICRKTFCEYDVVNKSYILSVWGDEYAVYPHEYKIDCISSSVKKPHEYFYLFIIYYLLKSKEIELCNEWISEKDIPGGATFFRGPHEIPTNLISELFGNDIERFRKKCTRLYGTPIEMADAAFRFNITPHIPVAVLYWLGDEEFSPEAKILYDKTITRHLTSDIIFVLAVEVCSRIGR
ncbi:MAG: DUF3786 domain-containing protein [Proteobacteria bacterium]|nr:DUF3786 domain-containing protein [Pseudomonadota bacterium]